MKFAVIADIHLSRYSQDKIEDESNLPERLHSIKASLYEVAKYCLDNGIKTIVIAGDILHGKSIIYAIAQEIMLQFIEDHEEISFYIIDGNHDLSGKSDIVVSALRPLGKYKNVTLINYNQTYHEFNTLFVPYSSNIVDVIKQNKAKILISHFGLSEGTLNSGISIISDIKLSDLEGRYELVLLGHYHKPQEIIRENLSLYYVGSLIQLDWGEKDDDKRFLIVDSNTLDVQSIPISNYRKHIEIKMDSKNKDKVLELAKSAKEAGNYVKIVMTETVDVSDVKDEFNIIDRTEVDITNRGITSSMSQQDRFKRFIEIKEIPDEKRDAYLKAALEIIDECEE